MAATYADLTGTPGAVLVTRGPGLASAVNGIAHAALDRLPVIVIADTVKSAEADRISHQRLDLAALGRAVAKAVVTVGGSRAGDAAADAVCRALASPAGPVVVLMDDSRVGRAPSLTARRILARASPCRPLSRPRSARRTSRWSPSPETVASA